MVFKLLRSVIVVIFLFVGFFSYSFAGKWDSGNTELINQLTNEVLNSERLTTFNSRETDEARRELATLTDFAKEYPQDQNNLEDYQVGLLENWRKNKIEPLIKILSSDLQKVPTAIAEITNRYEGLINSRNPSSQAAAGAVSDGLQNASTLQNSAQQALDKSKEIPKESCGLTNIGPCFNDAIVWLIKKTLLNIAIFFLWLTSHIFDYSVHIGILNFKEWAPDTLYPIWLIVRQILSLVIVFAGLYLGFLYILGKGDKFEHYIPWVVMFALFVNFSYPLTRTAIDISNVVSLNIYSAVVGPDALKSPPPAGQSGGDTITTLLGIQDLQSKAVNGEGRGYSINTIPGALLAVAFGFYAAYIFLIAAGIMIMRTVSLIFITIASPFLLIDSVIPLLGEKAKELRKIFIDQLLIAPVFMIMFALTTKFLEVFQNVKKVNIGDATVVEFFNMTIMLIMLHVMIKVTKTLAGKVGNFASDALGKVGGFAGGAALGLATGGVGLLARGTIGRGAAAMTQQGGFMDKWSTKNGVNGAVGRRVLAFTDSIAKSSFDARNTGIVQKQAQKLGLSSGMGAGVKKGYQELQEDRAGRRLETRDRIIKRAIGAGKSKQEAEQAGNEYLKREMQSTTGSRFLGTYGKEKINTVITEKEESAKKEFENTYRKYSNQTSPENKRKFLADIDDADLRTKIEEKEKEDLSTTKPEVSQSTNQTELKPADIPVNTKQWDNGIDFTTNKEAKPEQASPTVQQEPPLTGTALREERIQKVAEGRAEQSEDKQQLSQEKAEKFKLNAHMDRKEGENITQTLARRKREERLKAATQVANQPSQTPQTATQPQNPVAGTPIPPGTAPTKPATNDTPKEASA